MNKKDLSWKIYSLLPIILILIFLTLIPLVNIFYNSFFDIRWDDGAYVYTFIGFQNYIELPNNKFYFPGLKNTVKLALIGVIFQMIFGFLIALGISKIKRGKSFFVSLFLLPILLPPIVIGSIWRLMYGFDFGIFNYLLAFFGVFPLDWLGNSSLAFISIVILDVWHWTPFVVLLLLAGLESLPTDVYEAGRVDGTSGWSEIVHITFPLMIPTIIVTMVFRFILSFKVFDEIYLLTQGGPGTATEVISFSIYETFFDSDNMGLGSVMSVVSLFVISALIIVVLNIIRRANKYAN
jgi:multiple sugar transport system permease protein